MGASLITKQGAVKKKNAYLFQHQVRTNKMEPEYLENCLNLYSRKRLRPRHSFEIFPVPLQLWQLKVLLRDKL